MLADESKCVNCHRCVSLCPTRAIKIVKTDCCLRENENWKSDTIREVYKQAATGGILLSSTGNPTPLPGYWDRLLINASQVTNPSIDPLREPMETRVFLGKKPDTIRRRADGSLDTTLPPQLELSVPILFSAMSYGSISYNAHASLARAAEELGIYYNTGEGGLHRDLYQYGANTIVQVASGRFGIDETYLNTGAAIEIKMGQGAKPGIGGHLPGAKIVGRRLQDTRMIPEGSDAISPAPHHDIYSIEDLRQLVYSLKEATQYKKPVIVKVAAVHNIAAIASGIARSGADIIAIDGYRGGTGAAPTRIRDNVGIPIELALAAVDQRLRDEGIRISVSLIAGSIRSSADVVKAIALGADACYIATARAARHGLPSLPLLPDGTVQLGHRHAESGACQAAGSRRRRGAAREPGHCLEARDQGDDGRHGHQLHRGAARQPRDAPRHRPHGEGTRNPRRGSRRRMIVKDIYRKKSVKGVILWIHIEAGSLSFSELNETIRSAGAKCRVSACLGQRFIAAGMSRKSLRSTASPATRSARISTARTSPCTAMHRTRWATP